MSGTLPAWLSAWLGAPTTASGDAATWQLDSAWRWAPWVTVLLIFAAIAWTVFLYSREATSASRAYRALLVAMRLVAIGLVLIMIAEWAIAVRITGPPSVAVVIDNSASMNIADQYQDSAFFSSLKQRLTTAGLTDATRLNLAKLLINEDDGKVLRDLAGKYRIELYAAAGTVERLSHDGEFSEIIGTVRSLTADSPKSQASRLGDAVRQVLDHSRGAPPAAIIMLTDGETTEGIPLSEAAQAAHRQGVPLFTIGIGNADAPRDIELVDMLVDDAVFAGDLISFQIQIKASGLTGEPAQVVLRRQGESSSVAEREITLPPPGETLTLNLLDRPTEVGALKYVVEVLPRADELDGKNNRQVRTVTVRDEKIRVLLVQGYPSYEFRFLKSLLDRDSTIQLSTYLQDADPEYAEQDKSALRSFPVRPDDLFEYDVILIGDVDPRLLPRSVWQNVNAFVTNKGGGVAFIGGPRYLPWLYQDIQDITGLLPIDISALSTSAELPAAVTSGFVVKPTQIGLQSPAMQLGDTPEQTAGFWSQLAPLFWLVDAGALKPGAQVLAEGPNTASDMRLNAVNPRAAIPAICFQYVGAGRVLYHAVDSTWRWRIGAGESLFARYWIQAIRFLARGKLSGGRGVQLTADRREYRSGETAQVRARFLDPRLAPSSDDVTVLIDSPGKARRRVTLRRNLTADGVFDAALTDLSEGRYEVVFVEPQMPGMPPMARFVVTSPPGEFARPEMNIAALTAAAKTTHGKFYTMADSAELLANLPTGRRVPVDNLPPIPLWNRWWMLTAFVGCLTSEWLLRKRKGML